MKEMKQMKCLDCGEMFKAKTPNEMMKEMMPHYMKKHSEMMKGQNKETQEEWMQRFDKEWKKAKDI